MKQFMLSLLLFSLLSCDKDKNIDCLPIQYNQKFTAKVGEKYCLNETDYIVLDSIENQLCPCDAECFWEGEFILKMKVWIGNNHYAYDIGTSEVTPDKPPFDEFRISFESIHPSNCDSNKQEDFRVKLKLIK